MTRKKCVLKLLNIFNKTQLGPTKSWPSIQRSAVKLFPMLLNSTGRTCPLIENLVQVKGMVHLMFLKPKKEESIFKRAPNTSGRKAARLAQCSDYLVRKVKANAGLKTYKAQKVPDRNPAKNLEAKNRARKLKSSFIKKYSCCIMDDETYVLADFSQLPGQKFYVADARGNVEEKFRTQKQTKFPKKFLVWQAICSCGEIYIKECLKKGCFHS